MVMVFNGHYLESHYRSAVCNTYICTATIASQGRETKMSSCHHFIAIKLCQKIKLHIWLRLSCSNWKLDLSWHLPLSGKSLKQNIHRSTGSPHTSWLPSTPSPTSDSYKIIMKDWSWYNFILIESTCMCTNMTTVPCKVCATGLRAHWLINPAFNLNRGDESFDSHYQYKCWSHSGYVGDHLFLF